MWAQYRKRLVVTQLFICFVSGLLLYTGQMNASGALMVFAVMQVAALAGAWLGSRLKSRIEADRNRLPLDKR